MQYDEQDIAQMVSRFLAWPLPADFAPDGGITLASPNYAPGVEWRPVGTNLLTAAQAATMIRHILATPPATDAAVPAGDYGPLHWRSRIADSAARLRRVETGHKLSAVYDGKDADNRAYQVRADLGVLLAGYNALAATPKVASNTVSSETLIAKHNAQVDAGTLDPDPRHDSNHPLHDIVCGWCGKIHHTKVASDAANSQTEE